jgi:hypothetical protein
MIRFIRVAIIRTGYKVAVVVIWTLSKVLMCLLSGDTETERHISLLFLINKPRFLRSVTAYTRQQYFTRRGSWKQQTVWHEVYKPSSIKSGLQTSVTIWHVYQFNMSSVYMLRRMFHNRSAIRREVMLSKKRYNIIEFISNPWRTTDVMGARRRK